MPKKTTAFMIALLFGMGGLFCSCAGVRVKPTDANFKSPIIELQSVEVAHYDGYWYYSGNIKPTKGQAGDHGAPLVLNVTFNITNPNPYPVFLDGYRFTLAFDGCDIITIRAYDTQWIPAGMTKGFFSPKVVETYTNQLVHTTMVTTRSALLGVGAVSGHKLNAMGLDIWQAMEKWWTTVEDLAFPMTVYDGAFTFKANGVSKVLGFNGKYPM